EWGGDLMSAFVVAREFFELLFPSRDVLDSLLVSPDTLTETTFFGFEDLELCLHLAERLLQPEHIRRDGRDGRGRWRRCRRRGRVRRRLGRARFGGGELPLERRDLGRQFDDVAVSVRKSRASRLQALLPLCQL